jgi:kynurenine 3-monooxygenase
MQGKTSITMAGAGLVGALQSIYLKKRGFDVQIFERRPDMRSNRMNAGRSINLALSDRGFKGLEGVGIAQEIRDIGIPMYGRMIHDLKGNLSFQPYGKDQQAIYSVSRGGLNCKLMDLAEREGVKIHFEHTCTRIDLDQSTLHLEHHGKEVHAKSDLIIGSDGAYSEVRQRMQKLPRFNFSQYYIEHGYKELTIPPAADGSFRMEKNALHIWPRGEFMLIALPNQDGSFTCTLFFPFEGEHSFASLDSEEKMLKFFNEIFPDAVPLMPDLKTEYFANPTSAMVIVKCFPWTYQDKAMLMGDASHAIVPFYGQGMNSGFEDCSVFAELYDSGQYSTWIDLLKAFEKSRKPNTDAIAELALRNFIEMRDKVADEHFVFQKKIEAWFSDLHPDKWIPLYSMVTFSHLPYDYALKNGAKQDEIMREVIAEIGLNSEFKTSEVEQKILSLL